MFQATHRLNRYSLSINLENINIFILFIGSTLVKNYSVNKKKKGSVDTDVYKNSILLHDDDRLSLI